MRGRRDPEITMMAFINMEARVPPDHPLRTIKTFADQALAALSPVFDRMYQDIGRPSVPPERLLKASLLMSFFSVRSERAFCEELDYNLLWRWFLDMNLSEPSLNATTFTKNRANLLKHRVGQRLPVRVVYLAYRSTLQAQALALVAKKLQSSWRNDWPCTAMMATTSSSRSPVR